MDFLKKLREEQLKKVGNKPRDKPVKVWLEDELFAGKRVKALTIILRTSGCFWAKMGGCTMCGYIYDSTPEVYMEELLMQFQVGMEKLSPEVKIVKLFTSGSFLDPREVPIEARNKILNFLGEKVEKVVVESRPEFVEKQVVLECRNLVKQFEIAIGLETSNDKIRRESINKGFSFKDFIEAAKVARECGVAVKAYLLLKPPFLSERAAIEDVIKSIEDAAYYVDTISINLCNVQRGTLVHELYINKSYRPPWLWSAVEVLRRGREILSSEKALICDPVAAGFKRGPHNCGKCDREVAVCIREFSLKQDVDLFKNLYCECFEIWRKTLELEDYTFGAPLL